MGLRRSDVQTGIALTGDPSIRIPQPLERLSEGETERKRTIGRLTTQALLCLVHQFVGRGFEWLLPVVLSKSTDPLWPDPGASLEKRLGFEIYGVMVRPTASMIVQKIVSCSLVHPKLFTLSPNIRIERSERASTGRHIYEFTQLDFEARYAGSDEIRRLVEDVLCEAMERLRQTAGDELSLLGRRSDLRTPRKPFKVHDREALEDELGEKWEDRLASDVKDPVWVTNTPREFYDFEGEKWDNYDLILPGYGEVLSGSRREWEYPKLVAKMRRDGVRVEDYELLLALSKAGRLKPSAGAGIGVERLIGWIVGAEHVGEVQLFPKVPGLVYDL